MKHYLTLLPMVGFLMSGSVAGAEDASKKGFSSVMSGTMKSGLPTSTSASFINRIVYPRIGEFRFHVQRWCGDGDVASYYEKNPDEDWGQGEAAVKLVMGYWVSMETPSTDPTAPPADSVPTEDSWFSVGYGTLQVNGSSTAMLYRANSKNSMSASKIISDEYTRLMGLAKFAASGKSYKFYSAAMLCHKFQDSDDAGLEKATPLASQISGSLLDSGNSLQTKLAGMSVNDKFVKTMKISISHTKDKVEFAISNTGTGKDVTHSYIAHARFVKNFSYPLTVGPAKYTVSKYRNDVSPLISRISGVVDRCEQELANPEKKYWFEPFGLSISCNTLKKKNISALKDVLNMAGASADSETIISEAAFKNTRDQLADLLAIAALQEEAQVLVHNDSSLNQNKTRCFAPGRYLNKVLASMALPFRKQDDGKYLLKDMGKFTLPESNYALGGATKYYKNSNAIFMNFADSGERPAVEFSRTSQPTVDFTAALGFNFNLRDVGCGDGPVFCKLDRGVIEGAVN